MECSYRLLLQLQIQFFHFKVYIDKRWIFLLSLRRKNFHKTRAFLNFYFKNILFSTFYFNSIHCNIHHLPLSVFIQSIKPCLSQQPTIKSISTKAPTAKPVTPIQVLEGSLSLGKYEAYTLFILSKSAKFTK